MQLYSYQIIQLKYNTAKFSAILSALINCSLINVIIQLPNRSIELQYKIAEFCEFFLANILTNLIMSCDNQNKAAKLIKL